jgi:hypothetical protein
VRIIMRNGTERQDHHARETRVNIGKARCYQRRTPSEPFSLGALREIELFKFIEHDFGASLPDDDLGKDVLRELLNQLALNGATPDQLRKLGRDLLPELDDDDSLDEVVKEIGIGRKRKADAVAREIDLTYELRTLLDIRTIGACDMSKAGRAAISAQKQAADKRWSREQAGAKPHAKSARKAKPWETKGISRSAYYARQKRAAETAKNSSLDYFGGHTLPTFPSPKWSRPVVTELEPGAPAQAEVPPQPTPWQASFDRQEPEEDRSSLVASCAAVLVSENFARASAATVLREAHQERNRLLESSTSLDGMRRLAHLSEVIEIARDRLEMRAAP